MGFQRNIHLSVGILKTSAHVAQISVDENYQKILQTANNLGITLKHSFVQLPTISMATIFQKAVFISVSPVDYSKQNAFLPLLKGTISQR